ncbi:MAG: hypothetical protein Kow00107_05300 [Planctomycetota bacterium]
MLSDRLVRIVLWSGFVYDTGLGLAFLLFGSWLFAKMAIEPPNHMAYLHLISSFVICLGFAQAFAAMCLPVSRQLVLITLMMKAAYFFTVVYHYFTTGLPTVWMALGIADAVFGLVFLLWLLPARSKECCNGCSH